MEHDINLNVHYSVPEELWQKIVDVFRNMPYWFEWEDFENIEYNISAEPPCFVFKSEPYIELRLYFDGFSKKKNRQNLRDFNAKLNLLGLKTSGL